jgi:hypothetical protein
LEKNEIHISGEGIEYGVKKTTKKNMNPKMDLSMFLYLEMG